MAPQNPFASPSADIDLVDASFGVGDIDPGQAQAIRRAHVAHEASVRSIGLLYLLGGTFGVITLVSIAVGMIGRAGDGDFAMRTASLSLLLLIGTTVGQLAVGVGLRRLRRWAQVIATSTTGLGLLTLVLTMMRRPLNGGVGGLEIIILIVMTCIPVYVLWLLVSPKGRVIFSNEYQAIRAMTPEITYRTSMLVKACIGLLATLIVLALVFAFFGVA